MHHLIETLYFFLPAIAANAAPVFASRVPFLNKYSCPLDSGIEVNGKRILGDHKTVRGVCAAILVAYSVILLQRYVLTRWLFQEYELIDYTSAGTLLLYGFAFGFGAVLGDIFGSFLKRRIGLGPGEWMPYLDQADYIIGVLFIFVFFSFLPTVTIILLALCVIPFITLAGSYICAKIGIKKSM